jgi:alpha-1,3-glucosyltransferase
MVAVSAATLRAFALVSAIKLLFVPCYYSTDFEVHRNWLAVTGTLPMRRWYVDATSEWTLDYPPLFAHFERALALVARLVDPDMLRVQKHPYVSFACVVFQRCTVIAADSVLAVGTWWCAASGIPSGNKKSSAKVSRAVPLATFLVLFSPGLLMVDHVHFQYNGVGLGIQLCAAAAANSNRPTLAAFLFSCLVHFKHVFAYAAPAFAAHLLAHHVPGGWAWGWHANAKRVASSCARCFGFIGVAILVSAVSIGPFLFFSQLDAVLSRLFPFGRGLSHAYWAPNFWALYNAADKVLARLLRIEAPVGYLTRGMAGHGGTGAQSHVFLPAITPRTALTLVAAASFPGIRAHAVTKRSQLRPSALPRLAAHVALCAFAFGWHVHEKAILMVVVPLGVGVAMDAADDTVSSRRFARETGEFLFLSATGTYALCPLLFEPREWPLKIALIVLWHVAAFGSLREVVRAKRKGEAASGERVWNETDGRFLGVWRTLYLCACLPAAEMYASVGHAAIFGADRLAFLPLAATSVTSAVGVCLVLASQITDAASGN